MDNHKEQFVIGCNGRVLTDNGTMQIVETDSQQNDMKILKFLGLTRIPNVRVGDRVRCSYYIVFNPHGFMEAGIWRAQRIA